jgi:hypothetical protein
MSARYRSRWLSAAALLAAVGLPSVAAAQSAPPPGAPQTAPAPAVLPLPRLFVEPLLLEQEQVTEHCDMPRMTRPAVRPPAPTALPAPGQPTCQTPPEEVMLRCLLFSIHPVAAFLPIEFGQTELPPPNYLEHPPQYCPPQPELPRAHYPNYPPQYSPPSPAFPLTREPATSGVITSEPVAELIGLPHEAERLDVMPVEVEQLKVMPAAEESEQKYQLLGPWTDDAQVLSLPLLPLAEIKVRVQEAKTGSFSFGIGAELSRTGTFLVSTEPPPAPEPAPAEKKADVADAQVQLNLLVAEVDRKGARALGFDREADDKAARWVIEAGDESREKALEARLIRLRQKGHAKVVAEPRLVTLSGHEACFVSGGQQPVPAPTAAGQAAIEFIEFGTKITCRPVVLADGTIHLDVEPEISELCETAGVTVQGTIVPGRSSQRVHATADIAPGHTLVISGPTGGGNRRLVVLVTPAVVSPAATDVRHLTPERVHGGVGQEEASVHELLEKCQRELSRGHNAAAEELAQQALTRDRKQVEADPLVCQSDLLRRVKACAVLPLGTVSPGEAKPEGRGDVMPGEDKAIGSAERMVEALMQEYGAAYREGRYSDAEALAGRALELDPYSAVAAGALQLARAQARARHYPATPQVADAMLSFENHFKQGRYEEAKAAALQALSVAPGDAHALAALQMAGAALSRQPHPAEPPQCPYVGPGMRLQPADPAVVSALKKLLIDPEKGGPAGGAEEAEPRAQGAKPVPPR